MHLRCSCNFRWSLYLCFAEPHNGTAYGMGCMQMPAPDTSPRDQMSEDCLTLDIYTPVDVTGDHRYFANKAVMVWVHGGGFMSGNSRIFEGMTQT